MTREVIEVGKLQVPNTPYLRKQFERIHARFEADAKARSGQAIEPFSFTEQREMYQKCIDEDVQQQETDNMLELLHYLAMNGVTGRRVISELKCKTEPSRMTNSATGQPVTQQSLSCRLTFSDRHDDPSMPAEEKRQERRGVTTPNFIAQNLQGFAT